MSMNIRGLSNDNPYVYDRRPELPTIRFRAGSVPALSQPVGGTDLSVESRECEK